MPTGGGRVRPTAGRFACQYRTKGPRGKGAMKLIGRGDCWSPTRENTAPPSLCETWNPMRPSPRSPISLCARTRTNNFQTAPLHRRSGRSRRRARRHANPALGRQGGVLGCPQRAEDTASNPPSEPSARDPTPLPAVSRRIASNKSRSTDGSNNHGAHTSCAQNRLRRDWRCFQVTPPTA